MAKRRYTMDLAPWNKALAKAKKDALKIKLDLQKAWKRACASTKPTV